MERIKYRIIVYNKLWSNPKMNLYVTNPQFNNIHAVAHLHAGVHPWFGGRRPRHGGPLRPPNWKK